MNVNEFAKDVHENAVAHGWWDTARSFPEVAALIHSEVSEALEEWRDGNPAIYGCCGIPGAVCEFEGACDKGEKTGTCKPEGVAVELCDAVMAIKQGREYRALQDFSLVPRDEGSKEYRVRGTATGTEATGKTLYRVQVGAFSVKENAESFLQEVKALGLSNAFITEVKV